MARRARKKTRGASKSLTTRVAALEKAIFSKGTTTRRRRVKLPESTGRVDMTPPHIRRQLGL